MTKLKWSLFLFIICVCAILSLSASADVNYTMVRQGSTGEAVQRVQMRLRELGFLNFKPTGSFKAMTVKATIAFQQMQVTDDGGYVAADGEAGPQTQAILFSPRARRASIPAHVNIPIGPSLHGTPKVKGTLTTWEKMKQQLNEGSVYKIFDYNTGKSFRVLYKGGENHAEVECASKDDSVMFLTIAGGTFNYSKRPVVIQMSEDKFVAASIYCYPHGEDFVKDNDMEGHLCLFFDGSRSHVGQVTDVEHQKQIYTAAGM